MVHVTRAARGSRPNRLLLSTNENSKSTRSARLFDQGPRGSLKRRSAAEPAKRREARERLSFATRSEDPVADYIACRRIPATPNRTKRAAIMISAHSPNVGMGFADSRLLVYVQVTIPFAAKLIVACAPAMVNVDPVWNPVQANPASTPPAGPGDSVTVYVPAARPVVEW